MSTFPVDSENWPSATPLSAIDIRTLPFRRLVEPEMGCRETSDCSGIADAC